MMTIGLEVPQSMNSREPLETVLHFAATQTMCAAIEDLAIHLNITNAAVIRLALEDYLCKLEEENTVDYFRRRDDETAIDDEDLESYECFDRKVRERNNQLTPFHERISL